MGLVLAELPGSNIPASICSDNPIIKDDGQVLVAFEPPSCHIVGKGVQMNIKRHFTTMAAAILLSVTSYQAMGQGVSMIEDFESYEGNVGSWTGSSDGISVGLNIGTSDAIQGDQDMALTLGANLLGGSYTIQNYDLDVPISASAENFIFTHRVLLGLSLGKAFVVTLRDQDDVEYVSPSQSMGVLQLNATRNFSVPLSSFTPPADEGVISNVTGVRIEFSATTAVSADEHIDTIRVTWDNSSVDDWSVY